MDPQEMTAHFLKLSCANCGHDLDVYDDMDRFFCGQCGAGIEVDRRGGTVSLRIAGEASGEPIAGRLQDEVEALSKRRESMLAGRIERNKWGFVGGVALLALGFMLVRTGFSFVFGLMMMLAGFVTIVSTRRFDKKVRADARDLQSKIDLLNLRAGHRPS
jgi:ribosomal protein S27AE